MGTILFECPATGRPISTGIETEPISFCRLSRTWVDLYCPECGRFHGAKIWLAQETSASACFSKSALSKQTHIALHRQPRLADHRLNRSCLRSAPSSKHRSNCIPSGNGSHAQSVSMIHCSVIRDPAGTRWAEAFARQVSFHAMGWIHLKNLPAQSCRRSPQHRSYWSDVRVALSRR